MANYVGIWKYDNLNYFDVDLDTCIDKIQIDYLPLSSFPVFDLITEDINSVGVYKAGDFAVSLLTTGGETSVTLGESVSTFFRGGTRNYKFLIGIQFGTQKFWGTFTNADVEYDYKTKRLDIRAGAIDYEAKEQMSKYFVGSMNTDKTVEDFFQTVLISGIIPSNKMICYAPFVYSTLIGGAVNEYKIRYLLQASGSWVNTVDVWQQMVELLLGTGLLYYIYTDHTPNVSMTDFPQFVLKITYLEAFTASATTPIIFDAQEKTTYKNNEWLFLKYRRVDISEYFSALENEVWDGIISDGTTIYDSDKFRVYPPTSPIAQYCARGFHYGDTVPDKFTWIPVYPPVGFQTFYIDKETTLINLPLYSYTYAFEGNAYPPPTYLNGKTIAYSRIITDNNWHNWLVQQYAINQYKRYIGNVKRQMVLRVKFDDTTDYGLYKTILIDVGGRLEGYYIAEMRNLDITKKRVELTVVRT